MVRLSVELYNNTQFCGNWQVREHGLGSTCFHLVTVGECWLAFPDAQAQRLAVGDLVLLPKEVRHSMHTVESSVDPMATRAIDPNAEGTALLCGYLRFEHNLFAVLLDQLPEVIVIRRSEVDWLEPLLHQIIHESMHVEAGSAEVLNRLSELLFTYALRHVLNAEQSTGTFLKLYVDERVGPAIQAIHAQPDYPWTITRLAEQCAMSRTSFAQYFKQLCGWTVNGYLTWWRMQLAWKMLSDHLPTGQVAEAVGYQSESAFSRVFKKTFGMHAGHLRRANTPLNRHGE